LTDLNVLVHTFHYSCCQNHSDSQTLLVVIPTASLESMCPIFHWERRTTQRFDDVCGCFLLHVGKWLF